MIVIVGNDTPLAWAFATAFGRLASVVDLSSGFMNRIEALNPKLIINCATISYESLKVREQNELEFRNVILAEKLAWYCKQKDCVYWGFSGENIFSGLDGPYDEHHDISAVSMMGRYQMAGEYRVEKYKPKYLIFRHSWLLSPIFDNLMLDLLSIRTLLNARGRPTYVMHMALSLVVWWLDRGRERNWNSGIYMLSNSGPVTSLKSLTSLLLQEAGKPGAFNTVETKRDFTFRCASAEINFGIRLPRWEIAAHYAVKRYTQLRSGIPFKQDPNIWAN